MILILHYPKRCLNISLEMKNKMQYLLDTHVILWWLLSPEKIGKAATKIIRDKTNILFLSSVSFWEMAIKKSIGRLTLPHNLLEVVVSQGFKLLPIMPQE